MPTLKKSLNGARSSASAVMNPPPEWPHIAALVMSIHGYFFASSFMPAIWSGIVLSRPIRP